MLLAQVEQSALRESLDSAYQVVGGYLPKLVGALIVLVLGWLAAVLLSLLVRSVLRRTGLDRRLAGWFSAEESVAGPPRIEEAAGKGVFYLVMLVVVVGFFEALGLSVVTKPLNDLLEQVFVYLPRLVGAGLMLLVAWIVATVLRFVIRRVSTATKLDQRLSSQAGVEGVAPISLAGTIADTVYWLVFLLFLPAILDALALPGLLRPVQDMVAQVLSFLPNIFAVVLILAVGWFVARIVQRVVTNLLAAVGADALSERVGLGPVFGEKRLSGLLGLVVYVLILIPVLVASLNALKLEAVTKPASEMLNAVLMALPAVFAAVLVLFIAYMVGRVVAGWTTALLTGIGFNSLPARLGLAKGPSAVQPSLSEVAGYLVLAATMLFAIMQALPILGFDMLAQLVSQFLVFAGDVVMGLVIFTIGLYLAGLAAQAVQTSRIAQADLLAPVARISILVLAGAMALRQMGLGGEIITNGFTLLLGAVCVALALAFGLGGREAATKALDDFIKSRKS